MGHPVKVPKIAPGLLFPISGMNCSHKMLMFSFFLTNQINLFEYSKYLFILFLINNLYILRTKVIETGKILSISDMEKNLYVF